MDIEVRPCASVDELRQLVDVIGHYFGSRTTEENAADFAQWIELGRVHGAWEGERIVGGAGAFAFRLSIPGGEVPAGGVTVVGVLPSHRRRGILTALMRAQLDDSRARGDAAAVLWASEGTIYPRFGYGLASRIGSMRLAAERTRFASPFEPRGVVRLVDAAEAAALFPPLYDEVFAQRAGMVGRTGVWWETRRLRDNPSQPTPPKNFALLELDGAPAGYVIYKVKQDWDGAGFSKGSVEVVEAIAPTADATRELWRWIFDFDWTSEFTANFLPLDHPLFLLLAEPRRLSFQLNDGVWVRLLDVAAALGARSYAGDAEVVVDVSDAFLPDNAGRWLIGAGGATRTKADAELAVDVTGLASVYLGGYTFADLVRGSRAEELRAGAVERADALFRTAAEPWCAEIF
jgi:predicted acetyltransferase